MMQWRCKSPQITSRYVILSDEGDTSQKYQDALRIEMPEVSKP